MSIRGHDFAAGSLIFLCCLVVHLSYSTTRVFSFSHAAAISFAPYVSMVAASRLGASPWVAVLVGVIFGAVPAFGYEFVVGRWMRNREIPGWQQMLASLGYLIVVQNTLALTFGDQAQLWLQRASLETFPWLGGRITVARILLCSSALIVAIIVWIVLSRTRVGMKIRGTASSPELAEIMGVEVEQIRMTAVMSSCVVAALAGVLAAADVDMTPGAGFPLFLAGMAAAIVGGMTSIGSLVLGALFLASCQQFAARFVHGSWIDSAAYLGLILVLIWKPLGFSGRRLKKVEV
jgi:branched-chain amino acid transport system permease protein